ncbi:MAG: hypothetical protein U0360_00995 [Dehalococcoidia bacterium]
MVRRERVMIRRRPADDGDGADRADAGDREAGDRFTREYRLASDAYPDYFDAGAVDWNWLRLEDGRATPHSVAFEDGNRTFSQRYLSGRKLNAHIRHVFYAPPVEPLDVSDSVEVERTYVRRGREHVEFLALVRDSAGRMLMASENDWVMNSAVRHAEDSPAEALRRLERARGRLERSRWRPRRPRGRCESATSCRIWRGARGLGATGRPRSELGA